MKTLIFDTETTSLITNSAQALDKQPHVIEFSGVIVEDGKVIAEMDFLCNPGIPIPAEVTKITGLKDSDVKGLSRFGELIEEVKTFIAMADEVTAHNLSYDFTVINFEAQRAKTTIPWPKIRLCTVEATEHIKGFRLTLTALHEHLFQEPFVGSHRAKADVDALTRCFLELRKQGGI